MKYHVRLIVAFTFVVCSSARLLARAPALNPYSSRPSGPEAIEVYVRIVQWGAIAQIATTVILVACLITLLSSLRRIEQILLRSRER
jgi:hypothetical protein